MSIIRSGTQRRAKGPADYFTGDVTIEWQFSRDDPARLAGAMVRFEAGARSNWHTHPLGQTLIVVSGTGWHQCEGEPQARPSPPATSSSASRTAATGMAPRPASPWPTSLSRRRSTARSSTWMEKVS